MNKSKFVALLIGLAGLTAGAQALADNDGLYLGAQVGNSQSKESACSDPTITQCDRKDTSWSGHLGFMFTPNWGAEVAYNYLGRVVDQDDGAGNTNSAKVKAVSAVLVGAFPIQSVSLYAKFGGYRAQTDLTASRLPESVSSRNNQWTYGVGIRWDVFKHLALRAEMQRFQNVGGAEVGFRSDVNTYSGGVLLTF